MSLDDSTGCPKSLAPYDFTDNSKGSHHRKKTKSKYILDLLIIEKIWWVEKIAWLRWSKCRPKHCMTAGSLVCSRILMVQSIMATQILCIPFLIAHLELLMMPDFLIDILLQILYLLVKRQFTRLLAVIQCFGRHFEHQLDKQCLLLFSIATTFRISEILLYLLRWTFWLIGENVRCKIFWTPGTSIF